MKNQLLVFDWDGVIFRTMSVMGETYKRALSILGRPMVSEAQLLSFIGPSDDDNARSMGITDPEEIQRFMTTLWAEEFEVNLDQGELYPGIVEQLRSLHTDYDMCVVSNGGYNHVHAGLVNFRILPYFDEIITSRAGRRKPESFALLAQKYPGARIIAVGDRRGDIEAGLSVGALCVGAAYGYGHRDEFAEAAAIADTPESLEEVIRSL